ncbi:MAG: aquaporin family protein [Flavobacteriaceae bacterium]|nr:aquaporin family protein [Flavobacteriaceae bacterium]
MSVYLAEFLGTFLLILIGGGVVAGVLLKNSKAENAGWNTITLTWGLAVTFAIYAVGSISGAHINPAVSLGFAFAGDFPWSKVPGYIIVQILGALFGAVFVWIFYLPHWEKTKDAEAKRAVFCTAPAIRSYIHNFVSEMIATAVLIFSLHFIGTQKFTEGLNPLVVGGLVLLIGASLGGTTGYAINPARDFGPRLAHFLLPIKGKGDSDWAYAPIPILGPILGSFLGSAAYKMLYQNEMLLKYWIVLAIVAIILIMAIFKGLKKKNEML